MKSEKISGLLIDRRFFHFLCTVIPHKAQDCVGADGVTEGEDKRESEGGEVFAVNGEQDEGRTGEKAQSPYHGCRLKSEHTGALKVQRPHDIVGQDTGRADGGEETEARGRRLRVFKKAQAGDHQHARY